jgi:hypothetical protein
VNQHIAKSGKLTPGNRGTLLAIFIRDSLGRLTDHLEIADDGIPGARIGKKCRFAFAAVYSRTRSIRSKIRARYTRGSFFMMVWPP